MQYTYYTFVVILALAIIFLWMARLWIGKALSDKDVPSSKRLALFMISISYCVCSIMYVFISKDYSIYHKLTDACIILLLAGVTTFPEIIAAYKKVTGKSE
jgi:hypothetical protein